MGASSNFGNMFSVLGASAFLPFLPMAPVQVLINNLLYDFSQTAIPTDNVDEEYLAQAAQVGHRQHRALHALHRADQLDLRLRHLLTMYLRASAPGRIASASLFQTGWFVESLLSQTLIIHVIRTRHIPFIESRASLPLMLTSLAICTLGIWLPFSPFAHALGFTSLPPLYWLILAGMLAAYLALTHVMKIWFYRRFGLS